MDMDITVDKHKNQNAKIGLERTPELSSSNFNQKINSTRLFVQDSKIGLERTPELSSSNF